MSFVNEFKTLPLEALWQHSLAASTSLVRRSLAKPQAALADFGWLISPAAQDCLAEMGARAHALTQQRFGKVIRLFAPLYLSNECVNTCRYCGFSRENAIHRVTLSVEEVRQEAQAIKRQGFRNILLVAGEHPKYVSPGYLADCVRALHAEFPSISLEVAPLETEDYRPVVAAGADGLVVYQETYDRARYAELHVAGPKKDFEWRMETPERGYAAGFRRLGIGALYGLGEWRYEALALAAHAHYLLRHCWQAQLTISLPRMRPHAGAFEPARPMSDRELAQLVCAFRLVFPDVGLVLSTRERPVLRDGLVPLGITLISAGSHTEPGGYTGVGSAKVHLTLRGQPGPAIAAATTGSTGNSHGLTQATEQFQIADERPPAEVARALRGLGYEPVWKDWDAALTA